MIRRFTLAALTLAVFLPGPFPLTAQSAPSAVVAQTSGTAAELADDRLAWALWRIAVETRTVIGFESAEFVRSSGWPKNAPPFPYSSRDEALRATVDADGRYEWRSLGDSVVVRPKGSWNAPTHPFNRPMRDVKVANGTSTGVLAGLHDFVYTSRFAVQPGQMRPVSFDVPSGTVVEVLNRLTEAADGVWWSAAYRPHAQPGQRYPRWEVQMQIRDSKGLVDLIAGHSPLPSS